MPRPIFPETGIYGGPTLAPKDYLAEKSIQPVEQTGPAQPPRSTLLTPEEIREYFALTQERMSSAWLRVDPAKLPYGISLNAITRSARWQIHMRPEAYISGTHTTNGRKLSTGGFNISVDNAPRISWWHRVGSSSRQVDYANHPSTLEATDSFLKDLLTPAEQQEPQPIPDHPQLAYPTLIDQFMGTFVTPFPNLTGLSTTLPAELGTWYVNVFGDEIRAAREKSGFGVLEEFSIRAPETDKEHVVYQSKPDGKPKGRRIHYWGDEAKARSLAAAQLIVDLGVKLQKPHTPLELGL